PRAVFVLVPFHVDRTEPFNHHESRLLSNPTPMVASMFRRRRRISDQSEENRQSPSEQQETVQAHRIRRSSELQSRRNGLDLSNSDHRIEFHEMRKLNVLDTSPFFPRHYFFSVFDLSKEQLGSQPGAPTADDNNSRTIANTAYGIPLSYRGRVSFVDR